MNNDASDQTNLTGMCLCGAVRFHGVPDRAHGIAICHCGQCRRWAAGPLMVMRFASGVVLDADETLRWFRSSPDGERGFCADCGSSLFWRSPGAEGDMAVSVNTLPEDHGLALTEHIWIEDKPGWYDFAGDAARLTAAEVLARDT